MWNGTVTAPSEVKAAMALLRPAEPAETIFRVANAKTVVSNGLLAKVYVFDTFGEGTPGYINARIGDIKALLDEAKKANPSGRSLSDYVYAIAFLYGFEQGGEHITGTDIFLFRAATDGRRDLKANLMIDNWSFEGERRVETRLVGAMCTAEGLMLGEELSYRTSPSTDWNEYFADFPGALIPGSVKVRGLPQSE